MRKSYPSDITRVKKIGYFLSILFALIGIAIGSGLFSVIQHMDRQSQNWVDVLFHHSHTLSDGSVELFYSEFLLNHYER